MKEKLKNNKQTVIGIVLLVVMVIGFSYAWFQLTLRGEKENVLKAGTLSLVLDDTMGDGISIENGVPVTDEDGKTMVPYTFTLENNGTLDSDYTIYLDDLELLEGETRMPDNAVKYYLTKDGNDLGLDLLSVTGENPNRILDSGVIAPGEKYTYTLRLWIADTATNEVMGTTFRGQVRIEAIQAKQISGEAFAVYSADDNSLRFYKGDVPNAGETYEGLTATAVYTGIEQLEATSVTEIPWYSYANGIEKVVVEDVISPINTADWFNNIGCDVTTLEMDVSKLDTSNVNNMSGMFQNAGEWATSFTLTGLSDWDTSNVTTMAWMFDNTGSNAYTFNIDLSRWDTSSLNSMFNMFHSTGMAANDWSIGDLSTKTVQNDDGTEYTAWDVSNVTNMYSAFEYAASNNASEFNLGDLSGWDVSNVTNMSGMFYYTAYNAASTFYIGDISSWNTASVTDMAAMFYRAGEYAVYTLDLSGWNVSNVTNYVNFNYGVTSKITPPTWVN